MGSGHAGTAVVGVGIVGRGGEDIDTRGGDIDPRTIVRKVG